MNQNHIIDDFLDALVPATAAMDFRTFSETNISWTTYDPLIAEPWTRLHTLPMIEKAAERGLHPLQTAELLHKNPSVIRSLLFFDLLMAKIAGFGPAAYKRIFQFYSDMLHALCLEDPFAKEGKNMIHEDAAVARMIGECEPADPVIARKLGQLANACYNLGYALYSDMNPELVYDNFGPYCQPDGRLFAVKIFHNLRSVELWPETVSLPIQEIDIGVLFEGVSLTVDYISHGIYQGDQINGLRGWWLLMDGERVEDLEKIDAVRQAIEEMAVNIFTQWRTLDFEARKAFYWRQKAWNYKRLFDALGLGWEPYPEVHATAYSKPLFQDWNLPNPSEAESPDAHPTIQATPAAQPLVRASSSKEALVSMLRDRFDPRKEIPGEAFK
jgi:hypothetical protein